MFSNGGGSNVSDWRMMLIKDTFSHLTPVKIREGVGEISGSIVKALRPNLRNTFGGHPPRGC